MTLNPLNLNSIMKNLFSRKILVIAATCILGWVFTWISILWFEHYGWVLFLLLPFFLGAVPTLAYGFRNQVTKGQLFDVSMTTLVLYIVGLLLFAIEGLICIVFVGPLALLCTWLGHWVAYRVLKYWEGNAKAIIGILVFLLPTFMAFENIQEDDEKLRSVTTSIEIDAPASVVWKNVIAFAQLDEPDEWLFKTGIAYPINATIEGEGVGAVRHCNFTTGPFVEPITVWDEPRLLRFSVTSQPPPMKEISPYELHPPHLDGFLLSKKGQFRLIELENGKTRLEGTTWYVNKIEPDFYWTLWSDYIVHTIHKRVLRHIRNQCSGVN